MRRNLIFVTSFSTFLSCSLFLWMFFVAATLEHTADLGGISVSADQNAQAIAYEFAARWRHGMAGNSPLYMPGFFAAGIAIWFWCADKGWRRMLAEGLLLLGASAVCAELLAPYATPRIISDFIKAERVSVSQSVSSGTWIAFAQGVYSLLTWATLIIASRWSIKLRSPKPLLIPLVLNIILAIVRPWTVADFTSQWIGEAFDGEPVAVVSLLLVPVLSAFLALVEIRPKRRKAAARKQIEATPAIESR